MRWGIWWWGNGSFWVIEVMEFVDVVVIDTLRVQRMPYMPMQHQGWDVVAEIVRVMNFFPHLPLK